LCKHQCFARFNQDIPSGLLHQSKLSPILTHHCHAVVIIPSLPQSSSITNTIKIWLSPGITCLNFLFSFLRDMRNTASQTDPDYLVQIITLTAINTVREVQSRQPTNTRPSEMDRAVLASLGHLSHQLGQQTRLLRQIRGQLRVMNSTRNNSDLSSYQQMGPHSTD